ncbi:MAG: hypothetical protein CL858_24300 [Cupriavidus sp.]|jgi:hypothetical protein|uniref:XRE family transcriptional regulator n=1 Tax=Cupriavidus pauculus TaxID=82633 RepID=UPI000C4C56AB|nr:XRE family transcriptional regulator [Cupriavidus pauculus]MBU68527.1 hypothetical protein [Cupriavidus sp.]
MRVADQSESGASKAIRGLYVEGKGRFFPDEAIASCSSFRDACALAWANRANPDLTFQMLAVLAGLQHQHVGDYFNRDERTEKGHPRRSLPAEKLDAVEAVLGNRILSQFLMYRGALTIMEAVLAQRAA